MSARPQRQTARQSWTPRYLAYAAAHGKTPEAMLDADTEQWPGGRMTGFALWIRWAWRSWDSLHGHGPDHVRSDNEQAAFTAWLVTATIGDAS